MSSVTITKRDLINADIYGLLADDYDFRLLALLKDGGAPIVGTLLLKPDEVNYKWFLNIYPNGDRVYSWETLLN